MWRRFILLICFSVLAMSVETKGQEVDEQSLQELEAQVADLFERSCARAGCHAGPVPQQGMHLGRAQFYASIVDVPSQERPDLRRVKPGDPDSSYLMMKVRGDPGIEGVQMPMIGARLTEEEVGTIAAWIQGLTEADSTRRQQVADEEVFPFYGWKVINLPTARTLDAGSWLFLISHRFNPKISDGYEAFYGLDGSGIIYLSLGYAFSDRLLAALGRSNASDNVELQLRYRILQQHRQAGLPLGVSVQGAFNWVTEEPPGGSRPDGEAFKFTGQLSLTHAFDDRLGLALVPGILLNPAEDTEGERPLITIGLGGRWRFWRNLSLVGEWAPIVSGFTRTTTFGNQNRFDTWGTGLEITTGGHVFQIVLTNSVGLATDQYLRGGDLDIQDGDVRLGFNIFRILNF